MKSQLRFPVCGAAMVALLMSSPATAVDLAGRVTNAAGALVEGATVCVFTAVPKVGPSPYCPSCYPDCGKTAKSDAASLSVEVGPDGEFEAQGIPPETVSLSTRLPGYILSPKNGSHEPANRRLVASLQAM